MSRIFKEFTPEDIKLITASINDTISKIGRRIELLEHLPDVPWNDEEETLRKYQDLLDYLTKEPNEYRAIRKNQKNKHD